MTAGELPARALTAAERRALRDLERQFPRTATGGLPDPGRLAVALFTASVVIGAAAVLVGAWAGLAVTALALVVTLAAVVGYRRRG